LRTNEQIMMLRNEKVLDLALNTALRERPAVALWLLSKTKFRDDTATYHWSRANHPWGRTTLKVINPKTGAIELIEREGETDVLVVFNTRAGRVALHIENKLASGTFTPFQPELYASRAEAWKNKPKYESYEHWATVLVAPQSFYNRFSVQASKFGKFVSHEELAAHIPEFDAAH
jgi:hypothetical protein